MRIAVSGAGGFVGSGLVAALVSRGKLQDDGPAISHIVAIDLNLAGDTSPAGDGRVAQMAGDIANPDFRERIFDRPFDVFFHLAAVPGGLAALDYPRGWSVNATATFDIIQRLANQTKPARLVLASSIGVFGVPLPRDKVDDETLPVPSMSYGAQKLMAEILIGDFARRGLVDGLAVRLPGIVARPRTESGHISAFMSNIFHALAAGEEFTCPVSETASSWLMSRQRCIDNLIHAAALPSGRLPARRAFNLPALRLGMTDIADAIAAHTGGNARARLHFAPDPQIESQFGAYPPLFTPIADSLGFRHDGTSADLAARALDPAGAVAHG